MSPELLSAFAALAAALTGWGMWWNARRVREDVKEGRRADDRSVLFDDALELAKAQKEISEQHKQAAEDATLALESVTVKAKQLENTIDRLMMDVDMWRGVAVTGAQKEKARTGTTPLWWPKDEPLPAAGPV